MYAKTRLNEDNLVSHPAEIVVCVNSSFREAADDAGSGKPQSSGGEVTNRLSAGSHREANKKFILEAVNAQNAVLSTGIWLMCFIYSANELRNSEFRSRPVG